jgi:predicted NBD/HSP70 family sugar kinase
MNSQITGNAKILRRINRGMILNIIREKQPISRSNIAKITGLNKSTVSSIASELLYEDLIYEQIIEPINAGRRPRNLYLKLGKFVVGAINIEPLTTKIAIVDIDGGIKDVVNIKTKSQDTEIFIQTCAEQLQILSARNSVGKLESVGISVTGIVDSKRSNVVYAHDLGWEDFNIGQLLKKYLISVKKISIEGNAKAAAIAELWFGKQEVNLSNFVFISIGHGIDTGIVIGNKLISGEFNSSGEFGHIAICENGELCSCGNKGCWQAYASDIAIVKRFLTKNRGKSTNSKVCRVKEIIDLAMDGNLNAIETLKQTGNYLGRGITNIIKAIDPKAIIIGGEISYAWDIIYPEMIAIIKQLAYFGRHKTIKILPSSLEDSPGLLGAATLAFENLFSGYEITDFRMH